MLVVGVGVGMCSSLLIVELGWRVVWCREVSCTR